MSDECVPVLLPLMGEGVHEATVVKWLKGLGEQVAKDEPVIEVSTDKVDTEIVSPNGGFLIARFAEEGKVVTVDQVLGVIGAKADTPLSSHFQQSQGNSPSSEPALKRPSEARRERGAATGVPQGASRPSLPSSYAGYVRTSPLCRKIAREHGINLAEVTGSGLLGRITKNDVFDFLEHGSSRVARSSENNAVVHNGLKTERRGDKEHLEGVPVTREPMSKIRRLTAEHMSRSVRVSPHVTTTFEMDLLHIERIRNEMGQRFFAERGFKLTYTPFFLYAAAQALREFPYVNAAVDGEDILLREQINLGCAVAIGSGLIVPVIQNAGAMEFVALAQQLNDLVIRAREKKLKPQDVQGGTFSVTNPGMFGSLHSQPIINQPQVAIMSIGAIVRRPVAVGERIEVRPLCQIGLTFDHRIIDGEGGAKFLAHCKQTLETFPAPY